MVSSPSGAFALFDPVRAAFDAAGGVSGSWGVPVSALMSMSYSGGGFGQAFANGSAYYRAGGSAFFVTGAIRDHYFSLGGAAGALGYPVAAQQCSGATSCQQEFQFGWILWTSAGGARVGAPAIDAAYAALGGPGGVLGARTSGLVYYSFNGGGFAEAFANGAISTSRRAGAHAVTGSVRDVYFSAGGAAGRFGWPTSDQTCAAGVCTQQFEGGPISGAGWPARADRPGDAQPARYAASADRWSAGAKPVASIFARSSTLFRGRGATGAWRRREVLVGA